MSENLHMHHYILMGYIENRKKRSNTTKILLLLKYAFTMWFCENAFLSVQPFSLYCEIFPLKKSTRHQKKKKEKIKKIK